MKKINIKFKLIVDGEYERYYDRYPERIYSLIQEELIGDNSENEDVRIENLDISCAEETHRAESLTIADYQRLAMTTCMDSCQNESYMMLNLVGEVGELASKMAKAIRKNKAVIDGNRFISEYGTEAMTDSEIVDMRKECGDVMWQIAGLCSVMGWPLDDVCRENLAKLADRKQRGVVDGNGDSR